MGVSEAKFDAGADFEICLAVAPQKPPEKLIFLWMFCHQQILFGAKNVESSEMRFGNFSRRPRIQTPRPKSRNSDPGLII